MKELYFSRELHLNWFDLVLPSPEGDKFVRQPNVPIHHRICLVRAVGEEGISLSLLKPLEPWLDKQSTISQQLVVKMAVISIAAQDTP